ASRSFARAARPIIAAGPAAGPTTSPALWKHRLSTRPGWKACRTAFRTVRPPRRCARSAIWISPNFRRSSRRAASAGTDHPPLGLTHVMHRDLPRPSLRATPGALRYGRGSLLCITWISPRQWPMRGHDWTRKRGRNWKRIDKSDEAAASVKETGQATAAARAYRAALARLVRGEGRHHQHAGQPIRITPAAVAREAGRSRNPLYATHRDILDEIEAAAAAPGPGKDLTGRVAELEAIIVELREGARRHAEEKRALASENLNLLHRVRAAEDRLAARELADARRKQHASVADAFRRP